VNESVAAGHLVLLDLFGLEPKQDGRQFKNSVVPSPPLNTANPCGSFKRFRPRIVNERNLKAGDGSRGAISNPARIKKTEYQSVSCPYGTNTAQ
jgi:hypothetical protein